MSYRFTEEKKRPPPITLPLPPLSRPPAATDQQRQQGQRPTDNTPLMSPVQTRPATLGSSRSRAAMATFTNLIDQARVSSPRKSGYDSWTGSHVGSAARSKHSNRSQHDAAAAQAQLEAFDEETARGKMESRAEKNLFEMTGQIPPSPTTDCVDENEVYIRTEDLRGQCRIATGEQQPERYEPHRSPKRKLFQNLRNTFSKSSSAAMPPVMPNKAAQILGTAARQARIIPVRPIKPARPVESTPTRTSRSETVKSLPAKVVEPDSYAHRHSCSGLSRRNRTSGRGSSGRSSLKEQPCDLGSTPPVTDVNASDDSVIPPPPPAKDTPPTGHRTHSPLRRAGPTRGDLRENYSDFSSNIGGIQFPAFDLSPAPLPGPLPRHGGASPTKFRPYTAEDYTKLVEGEVMHWPCPGWNDSLGKVVIKDPVPLAGASLGSLQLPRLDRKSEERPSPTREAYTYSPLQPRFYSPAHLSALGFAEGETPSKNSDTTRLLYSVPTRSLSRLRLRQESTDGSIKMIFQGDRQDIDPNSPTAREMDENEQRIQAADRRSDIGITTRVMQELRIGEQHENPRPKNGNSGQLQPDQSSSRLTDMLNTVSPGLSESHGEFQPYCHSAVPSPLHKLSGPQLSARSIVPSGASYGAFPQPLLPKTLDDHFFMTNEHLDVVGKTTWDRLEAFNKEQQSTSQARHEELLALTNRRFKQLYSHLDTLNDNAKRIEGCIELVDGKMDNQHNIHATVNAIKDSIEDTIPNALKEQDKKMAGMEAEMKGLRQVIQALQKSVEQKAAEAPDSAQPPFPSHSQRSQHLVAGHYGSAPEVGVQPVMQHGISSPQDGHNDSRLGYQNGNQWAARPGYTGRNGKEERPPYPTNPYLYNNGGQYNNGYGGGGYSPFSYSASPPEPHFGFTNEGQPK